MSSFCLVSVREEVRGGQTHTERMRRSPGQRNAEKEDTSSENGKGVSCDSFKTEGTDVKEQADKKMK